MSGTLLLIGCGNMGFALLKGWLAAPHPPTVHVVEPDEALRARAAAAGAEAVAAREDLPQGLRCDIVVLAVKPQVMGAVLPPYAALAEGGAVFLSIAAGLTLRWLESHLPAETPVLRCMPNTPAAIGAGVMALCANRYVQPAQRARARGLLATCGPVFDIADDALMDAVTAVSGSGPAYLFHFIEALTEAARAVGLPAELAGPMALQTILGSAQLAAGSEDAPGTLRQKVTSPGGTTAAALGVLMEGQTLTALVTRAVIAARDRGVALQTA
ncbi:pyrroline-5-carboxylate reductase [Acidisoma sp. 7E03]